MPPEEPSGEDAPPERRPPAHHKTEHRHPHGWRIDPGPDGRGTPDKESSAPPGLGWRFLLILVFLLAVNVTVVSLIGPEQKTQRVRIPYSPVFLTQVREGNVKSISSKGETVQGELRRPVRYPPSDRKATRTTHFNTEVPSHYFAASAARQFDALVHIDHSRAVEPLERTQTWDLGEPPETYPTAL